MSRFEVLNEAQLEAVAGGKEEGYCAGFKGVHKAIFWADKKGTGEGYFQSKTRQISEGFGKAGSTGAEVGIVATDAAIVGPVLAGGFLAFTSAGAGVGAAVCNYVKKAKSKIIG